MYVPPLLHQVFEQMDIAPTGWWEVAAVCFEEAYSRFSCYRATGQPFSVGSLHFSSLFYTGWGRALGRKLLREDLLPQTPCHLCECRFGAVSTLWRVVGIRSNKHFFLQRNKNNNKKKKKNSCIEWKISEGCLLKFCCQKSWCSQLSLFFPPPPSPWVIVVFSHYLTV